MAERFEIGLEPTRERVAEYLDMVGNLDDFEIRPQTTHAGQHVLRLAVAMTEFVLETHWTIVRFKEPALVTTDNPVTRIRRSLRSGPIRKVRLLFPWTPSMYS